MQKWAFLTELLLIQGLALIAGLPFYFSLIIYQD